MRTLQNLRSVDLGFRTDDVVTFAVEPATVYDEGRKRQVFRALIERLAGVPGVKAVGASRTRLLMGGRWDSGITIPGVGRRTTRTPGATSTPSRRDTSRRSGFPIKAGRDFTWDDWGSAAGALPGERGPGERVPEWRQIPVGRMMGQGTRESPRTWRSSACFANAHYENVRGNDSAPDLRRRSAALACAPSPGVHVYARTDRDPRQVMPLLPREA